jgi:very-short-patch-repair endonuclease
MAASRLESRFLLLWRVAQGPPLEREVKFHASRRWRADFAHLASRTLIEIEGGIFLPGGGRHSRGAGYAKDAEKYLEAVLAGWTVIRLTERQLEIDFIERIVAWIALTARAKYDFPLGPRCDRSLTSHEENQDC